MLRAYHSCHGGNVLGIFRAQQPSRAACFPPVRGLTQKWHMPTLCLPGPGTQSSLLLSKQIVPGRYAARFFFLCFSPLLSCSSPLYGVASPGDPPDFAAASEPAKMLGFAHLQLSLARKLLVLPQMSLCLQLCLPSWAGGLHISSSGE